MKNKGGRPTKKTEILLKKLQEAFLMGCTDAEACLYAEISMATLYNYQNEDIEFLDKKRLWKENPILQARKSVFNGLSNPDIALRFLERKKKDEFSLRQEITGKDGEDLIRDITVTFVDGTGS